MRLIGLQQINDAVKTHPDGKSAFARWWREVEAAQWRSTADIKERHASASFLADNTVVFNIGGNKYRIVARVDYQRGCVTVLHVLTHGEYDKWNRMRR